MSDLEINEERLQNLAKNSKRVLYELIELADRLEDTKVNKARLSQADHLLIEFNFCDNKSQISLFHRGIEENDDSFFDVSSIDEMMKKIDTIDVPKPKYEVGQTVYLMGHDRNTIDSIKIDEIILDEGDYWYLKYTEEGQYRDDGRNFDQYLEDVLYPTKLAFIDSQINYWQSFKIDDLESPYDNGDDIEKRLSGSLANEGTKKEQCEHEHNYCVYYKRGNEYVHPYNVPDFKIDPKKDTQYYKCQKCGEFYK